jgi:RNA polymerase-binding transcription factor DksA
MEQQDFDFPPPMEDARRRELSDLLRREIAATKQTIDSLKVEPDPTPGERELLAGYEVRLAALKTKQSEHSTNDYGFCKVKIRIGECEAFCGAPIAIKRLRALPFSMVCDDCDNERRRIREQARKPVFQLQPSKPRQPKR